MPRFHELRVADVERLCPDAVAVRLAVPPELTEAYRFRAGQALTLLRGGERRSYSLCAPEGSAPRIGVREVPGGALSTWLVREVAPGDTVEVLPPAGAFALGPGQDGHHVLIGAGSGITPLLSIAGTLLARGGSDVTLFYGNRGSGTVMFLEELADLKDRHPCRFELVHVLSREPRTAQVLSGRLDEGRLETLLGALVDVPSVGHWWLCGPHPMIVTARSLLERAGVPPDRVHRELFYDDDPPPPPARLDGDTAEPACEATVVLDGRATTASVAAGEAILDGAQRVRADLPFACKGGVCGTCRARLTSGEARLRRNFALEPAELAAGYVLTCQAIPLTPRVTVDYDA